VRPAKEAAEKAKVSAELVRLVPTGDGAKSECVGKDFDVRSAYSRVNETPRNERDAPGAEDDAESVQKAFKVQRVGGRRV